MVAQKRQSAGKGGKDNGGKSSFKSAGPHKRGPYRAVCAQGGVADGGRPCGLFNGAWARLRQIRAVCGGRRGGSAVFDHVGGHPRRRGGLPVPVARGYPRALHRGFARRGGHPLVAVGVKIHPRPSGLRTGHSVFAAAFDGHRHGVFKRLAFKCARHVHCGVVFGGGHGVFSAPHRAAFGDPPRDRRV